MSLSFFFTTRPWVIYHLLLCAFDTSTNNKLAMSIQVNYLGLPSNDAFVIVMCLMAVVPYFCNVLNIACCKSIFSWVVFHLTLRFPRSNIMAMVKKKTSRRRINTNLLYDFQMSSLYYELVCCVQKHTSILGLELWNVDRVWWLGGLAQLSSGSSVVNQFELS